MKNQNNEAALHPAPAEPKQIVTQHAEVGDAVFKELKKQIKLDAVLDFAIESRIVTTYRPVGKASGWFWRDQNFHYCLGEISKISVRAGGAAKSAIVTRANNSGGPTRPGRAFYRMLEEARGFKIKLVNGDYDPAQCEELWQQEMAALGYEIADLPQCNTYYAVLQGEPGNQKFGPMRRASRLLFSFTGPEFANDPNLEGYFAERFLPLRVVGVEDGGFPFTSNERFNDINTAIQLATTLSQHHRDVRILTQDDREIWRAPYRVLLSASGVLG
jgi:hypothetical protein